MHVKLTYKIKWQQEEQNSSRLKDTKKGLAVTKREELRRVVGREEIKGHNNSQSQYRLVTRSVGQHRE